MVSTTTYAQFIALDAYALWEVLGDPSRLPEWHSGYQSVTVGDAIAVGTEGSYVQTHRVAGPLHRRFAPPFAITAYNPGRHLQLTQKEPVGATVIDFRLTPADGGCAVSEKVTVTGPVSRTLRSAVPHVTDRVDFARLARVAGLAPAADALSVVLAGGSGALGQHLAADLACRGHRPIILTRSVNSASPFEQLEWDGRTVGEWADILVSGRSVAVVNLAGKLVDCRPTERNIALLRDSRVDATRALVAASKLRDTPIAHWLQASTTAIWSDAGEQWCTETTPVPEGLPQMTGVARPWEEAVAGAHTEHLVVLRTSIVLDNQAPAMKRLADLTRVGLGGRVGSGRQWFSWIHVDDWLAIARAALGLDPAITTPDGVVVGASPHPVRNAELMAALRRTLHRPPAPPTPAPLLRLGAVALRTDPALGLTGRRARSQVLDDLGFEFRFPHLDDALDDLLDN